ncbi:peptidylprolyl isomerase [Calothrix sp. HK-06]|nr:peptidylprolyl isomerase [Calothrix sp. HK-06]
MNAPVLQVGEQAVHAHELPVMLNRYQMMSQVRRGLVIDQAIANIPCNESERIVAITEFEKHNHGMTLEAMEEIAIRNFQIYKFKMITFGNKVESYFLKTKARFDQVIYSVIRVKDQGLASEIYFRIQAGEQSFSELAHEFSQGLEAYTGGILGPVALGQVHPVIGRVLAVSKPGQLWAPHNIEGNFVIIRLEKSIPARLDETMRRRLIDELFENWLNLATDDEQM